MTSGHKLAIAFLLIAATLAGLYVLTDSDGDRVDVPDNSNPPAVQNESGVPDAEGASAVGPDAGQPSRIQRPVRTSSAEDSNSAVDPGQGLEGTIVDSRGLPIADAAVHLFADNSQDLAKMILASQSGQVRRPLGSSTTEADGRFRIGVREIKANDRFEIWVLADRCADLTRPGVVLYPGEYFDIGQVKVQTGVPVGGVVRDKETGSPIAGATVQLIPPIQSFHPAVVPGRELDTTFRLRGQNGSAMSGLQMATDGNGFFRFDNAPVGGVRLVAFADGYARQEKQNVMLSVGNEPQIQFDLSAGMSLGGIIVDSENQPIVDVKITATAVSNVRSGQAETLTGNDGRFLLNGLESGPYQLHVAAPGFIRPENLQPVEAGVLDEVIVLESQGSALIQVVDGPSGRRIDNYSVLVRSYFPEQDQVGQSIGSQARQISSRDLENGYYRVEGLDPGRPFKVEVRARGYALTFSEPFEVVRGGTPPVVVVRMSQGGSVTAQILTPDGRPLNGALVETLPNNHQPVAGIAWLEALVVWNITRAQDTSSGNGKIDLASLTPGTYQIRIRHPDYSEVSITDIQVVEGEQTNLGGIELVPGTLVTGRALVDGEPAAQVKITVSKAPDAEDQPPFSAVVHTDIEGNFELDKRLPPGRYQVSAMRDGGGAAEIFRNLGDLKQTERQFTIALGQTEHSEVFQIVSQF